MVLSWVETWRERHVCGAWCCSQGVVLRPRCGRRAHDVERGTKCSARLEIVWVTGGVDVRERPPRPREREDCDSSPLRWHGWHGERTESLPPWDGWCGGLLEGWPCPSPGDVVGVRGGIFCGWCGGLLEGRPCHSPGEVVGGRWWFVRDA